MFLVSKNILLDFFCLDNQLLNCKKKLKKGGAKYCYI